MAGITSLPKSLRGFGSSFAQALFQHVDVEDIDAHGGEVALVAFLGFFVELDDMLLLVHLHDAEAVGLLDGHRHDGDGQARALGGGSRSSGDSPSCRCGRPKESPPCRPGFPG